MMMIHWHSRIFVSFNCRNKQYCCFITRGHRPKLESRWHALMIHEIGGLSLFVLVSPILVLEDLKLMTKYLELTDNNSKRLLVLHYY